MVPIDFGKCKKTPRFLLRDNFMEVSTASISQRRADLKSMHVARTARHLCRHSYAFFWTKAEMGKRKSWIFSSPFPDFFAADALACKPRYGGETASRAMRAHLEWVGGIETKLVRAKAVSTLETMELRSLLTMDSK